MFLLIQKYNPMMLSSILVLNIKLPEELMPDYEK
jgi:hypothetical protein